MVWAVEQVVAGRNLETPSPPEPPQPGAHHSTPRVSYLAMTPVPRYWHPYLFEDSPTGIRRFVQGRAYDLSRPQPLPRPAPTSDLLTDRSAAPDGPVHQLVPAVIPAEGLRVQSRNILARSTTGDPVIWTQQRRQMLETPPTTALRFDALEPAPLSP